MSDRDIILTCYGCFLGYLWPCLIGIKGANIISTGVGSAYVSIGGISIVECSEIRLQVSHISVMGLFDIG